MNNLNSMTSAINAIEVKSLYNRMTSNKQKILINFLKHERIKTYDYNYTIPIDHEYFIILDTIIHILKFDLELEQINKIYDQSKIDAIMNNIIRLLNIINKKIPKTLPINDLLKNHY